jgi:hypothetical protein
MAAATAPVLEGDARRAVEHRGSHMQIIACAGSGKTEVVAQRVADLIASGTDPAGIIAFTLTERAAEELKARISAWVDQRLGAGALDRLGAAFVGTMENGLRSCHLARGAWSRHSAARRGASVPGSTWRSSAMAHFPTAC